MMNGMKTKITKILIICVYFSVAALVFGSGSGEVLYRQTVRVKALSDGVEKTVYSTVGKENVENKITLIVSKLPSGDIVIQSEKFKLGKMPFSSSFQFLIPQENARQDTGGLYIIENLLGAYKVAASKSQAVLTGTLGLYSCSLSLAVNGMGKKLTMLFSSMEEQAPSPEADPAAPAD